ncbi:MAG: mechanosensitive ion channel family protein [Chloroflexia bacterium]|nr:mechanosensitive ion channel family protein [Chloroflexia bacterium]
MEEVWLWLRTSGLRLLLTFVLVYAGIRLARQLSRRLERWLSKQINEGEKDAVCAGERTQRLHTLRRVFDGLLLFLIVTIGGTMFLLELGLEVAPLLAGAGVVGIAISLGAQTLVKDFLAGLFVLIEDQYSIGDSISVAGVSGVVEQITLRATTLRDLKGTVHIVPNGEMRVVSNQTKDWARVVLRVGVAYDTDLDFAIEVLRRVLGELAADDTWGERLLEEPTVAGVDDLRDSDISLMVWIKTAPGDQWSVAREARKRILEAFVQEGIEIPYPTQVLLTRGLSPMGSFRPLDQDA